MTTGSHWDTCWKDSREHWECAVRQAERLQRELARCKDMTTPFERLQRSHAETMQLLPDAVVLAFPDEDTSYEMLPQVNKDGKVSWICEAFGQAESGETWEDAYCAALLAWRKEQGKPHT